MPTLSEREGWVRPKAKNTEIVSRFGVTSDFCLMDKGYEYMISFHFLFFGFAIWCKDRKPIIQWRGREWRRQRDEDFYRLHGCNKREWDRMSTDQKCENVAKYGTFLKSV